ncbi:DUF4297 domain-containing protein [Vibrio metschnikovii]|uniref:DUF4297 domain-containing protein n=3 Tax=Unclassified Bacteria TaxID=49928 RepID=A0AAU6UU32_UNCXX|nr:DUF4297 domain-containing protein [Vibrio metschnikovii]EKO3597507.1 DUF4297 domain-containing protein [Vibrio metschnikovii]EKO3615258.1 DUF4297 domain-containing protein [Vibrio metschnikovii]EKO3622371.1 DUF4297 domain-containing protein [Vibrio metschnikovii]EKO3625537.1 DUF4297 domain-containing protein [Vibrio metschnikovii]
MGLAEALVSIPQSERGGEIAQRGFDYQTCWALSQMLEYELDEKNYVFIFEYHDDVLILDDEVSPTDLTFAQVKTREKHWTASILSSTNKKPVSIIGKLFIHHKNFAEYSPKLLFVTNASFNLCEENGGKSCFGANEVKKEHQTSFKKAIKDQVELDDSSIDLSVMRFVQSSLSLDDHITHLKGKLCDFLSKKFGDSTNLSVNALASLLEQACRDKSKVKSADIIDFSDLISRKGFSSEALNGVLDSLNVSNSLKPDWNKASRLFTELGKTSLQLIILQATFSQVCIELNQNTKNPSTVYLEYAISLYDEASVHSDLKLYVTETMHKIDALCPDYALTLKLGKKECIVVYSVIQKLFEGGEE